MHELGEFVHSKGDVRTGHAKVLETANNLTVHRHRRSTIMQGKNRAHDYRSRDRLRVKHIMLGKDINYIVRPEKFQFMEKGQNRNFG